VTGEAPGGAPARLTFLTRRGCGLCLEARALLDRVLPGYRASLEVLDVDESPDLARRHGEEVPVLLVDGESAFRGRIDERRLRRRLRPWRRGALARVARGGR
jgi:glutaredoxin